jgi:hypothetical protein
MNFSLYNFPCLPTTHHFFFLKFECHAYSRSSQENNCNLSYTHSHSQTKIYTCTKQRGNITLASSTKVNGN